MAIWGYLAILGAQLVLSYANDKLFKRGRRGEEKDVTYTDPQAFLPVVYGQAVKVPTYRVFAGSTNNNNRLWQVLAYSHGQASKLGVNRLFFDGQLAWRAVAISAGANGLVRSGAPISLITRVGTTVTINSAPHHYLVTGDRVLFRGTPFALLNNQTLVITVVDSNKFTVVTASDIGMTATNLPGRWWLDGAENGLDWAKMKDEWLLKHHQGVDGETADADMVAAFDGGTKSRAAWTSAHRGRGIAYIVVRVKNDQNLFPTGQVPGVSIEVGGRVFLDVRTGLAATTDHLANPALALWDYLTNLRYGCGIPVARLNQQSFEDAADYCDELVSVPDGAGGSTTQKRYTANGYLDTGDDRKTNMEKIMSSMRGNLVRINGIYYLRIRKPTASSGVTIGPHQILGGFKKRDPDLRRMANVIEVTWVNPANGYVEQSFEWPRPGEANAYKTVDNGVIVRKRLDLPMTTNQYMAEHIASIVRHESRSQIEVESEVTDDVLEAAIGDVVEVTNEGVGFTAKEFWMEGVELSREGSARVLLREYTEAAYSHDPQVDADAEPDSDLPSPLNAIAPPSLTLSSVPYPPRVRAQWGESVGSVGRYELEVLAPGEGWRSISLSNPLSREGYVAPVVNGETYTCRVRTVTPLGVPSEWRSSAIVAVVEPFASPTFLAAVAGQTYVEYGVVFDSFTEYVNVYSRQHLASGGANPAESPQYLIHTFRRGEAVTFKAPTRNEWYRRTKLVAFNQFDRRGSASAVLETQAAGAGSGPAAAPSGLAASLITSSGFRLSWTNGETGAGTVHRIYRNDLPFADISGSPTTAQYDLSGLPSDDTGQYRVAHIKDGIEVESPTIEVTTAMEQLDTPVLSAYGGNAETGDARVNFVVTPGANSGGASFIVDRSPVGAGSWSTIMSLEGTNEGYHDDAGEDGNVFDFRVTATKPGYANSAPSAIDPGTYQVLFEFA